MARLPRLSLPGVSHYVLQHGHNGGAIVIDADDVERLLQALREAALSHGVVLHAYAVTSTELQILATPDSASGVSRMMQAMGRRYAAGFNRRHGRTGGLWDGRFRSALLEPGVPRLAALCRIDALASPVQQPHPSDPEAAATPSPAAAGAGARSSASHRTGGWRDAALVDPPEYWTLGNTPFERESRYQALLQEPLAHDQELRLQQAVRGSWAFGSDAFLRTLAESSPRPLRPRPRGRPRRLA